MWRLTGMEAPAGQRPLPGMIAQTRRAPRDEEARAPLGVTDQRRRHRRPRETRLRALMSLEARQVRRDRVTQRGIERASHRSSDLPEPGGRHREARRGPPRAEPASGVAARSEPQASVVNKAQSFGR